MPSLTVIRTSVLPGLTASLPQVSGIGTRHAQLGGTFHEHRQAASHAYGSTGKAGRTADSGTGRRGDTPQFRTHRQHSHHQLSGNKNSPHKQGTWLGHGKLPITMSATRSPVTWRPPL